MRAVLLALALAACSGGGGADSADAGADALIDAPDARPDAYDSCHVDCFGHLECVDGVALQYAGYPVPCDQWRGACPIFERYTCAEGCRTDVQRIDSEDVDVSAMCEENRPRRVGDACADDSDCHPQIADVPWQGPITHVYLRCDADAGRCAERPAPPPIPGFLESCGVAPDDDVDLGLHPSAGCASGWCLVDGQGRACVYQGCTAPCTDDGDCPPGTLCSSDQPRGRAPRACTPDRQRRLGAVASCR